MPPARCRPGPRRVRSTKTVRTKVTRRTLTSLLRRAEESREGTPFAHVVRDDDQDRRQRRERHQADPRPSRRSTSRTVRAWIMPATRRAPAVLDVGRGARDRAGGRDAAEERRRDVGDALRDELDVGLVAAADHAVGDDGGEQRLDGGEQGDRDRRREELPQRLAADRRALAATGNPTETPRTAIRSSRRAGPRRPHAALPTTITTIGAGILRRTRGQSMPGSRATPAESVDGVQGDRSRSPRRRPPISPETEPAPHPSSSRASPSPPKRR